MLDHKVEVIGERRFRIGRLTALMGTRIMNTMLASMAKIKESQEGNAEEKQSFRDLSAQEKAEGTVVAMWIFAGNDLPREKYEEFQKACLQCCSLYLSEDAAPTPILMANGRWVEKELEYDMQTIGELITKVLVFNLSPFFTESASKQVAGTADAPTHPLRPQTLTGSRSAR